MTRNTERRIEVACPIYDIDIKTRILWMLDVMYHDDTNAWDLQPDGSYILRKSHDQDNPKSSQEIFTIEAQNRAALLRDETEPGKYDKPDKSLWKKSIKSLKSLFK
jgi:polyphosphate kinase